MNALARQKVLVIGMGGLGCPATLALAQAGVRHFTLVDPDRVDATNLHRQPWYRQGDVGSLKAEAAAKRLRGAFGWVEPVGLAVRVDGSNVADIFAEHAVVIDGTDNIETKFLLSDAVARRGIPVVYGGVLRMQGQAMLISPGGPCLRCLFEGPPTAEDVPTCAQAGVLGSVAGIVGGVQALLALRVLSHHGQDECGKLYVFNGLKPSQRVLSIRRAPGCAGCGAGSFREQVATSQTGVLS